MTMRKECECESADVIEYDAIEELCPTEAADLFEVGEKYGIDSWSAAHWVELGVGPKDLFELSSWGDKTEKLNGIDLQQAAAEVKAAWKALQTAFAKATTVGESHLTLHVGYHSGTPLHALLHQEEPYFFWVEGAYQLSPAGEKFKNVFKS